MRADCSALVFKRNGGYYVRLPGDLAGPFPELEDAVDAAVRAGLPGGVHFHTDSP